MLLDSQVSRDLQLPATALKSAVRVSCGSVTSRVQLTLVPGRVKGGKWDSALCHMHNIAVYALPPLTADSDALQLQHQPHRDVRVAAAALGDSEVVQELDALAPDSSATRATASSVTTALRASESELPVTAAQVVPVVRSC